MNLRKQIDCTNSVVRDTIFKQYQEMCTRKIIIQNTLDDLTIKLEIVKKELERCQNRSELNFYDFNSENEILHSFKKNKHKQFVDILLSLNL